MLTDSQKLNIDLAAISVAKSAELVSMTKDSNTLNRLQNAIDDSSNRVGAVQTLLSNTNPDQVSTILAKYVDSELSRLDVVDVGTDGVEGVECLGLTMMPQQYLDSRIKGCEGFLSDLVIKTGRVVHELAINFADGYTLLKETHDSLEERLNGLATDLEGMGTFTGKNEEVALGFRLFNLFQVNRTVKEDWVNQLSKVGKTISGLSSNYYVINKNNLNTTFSYFGGFGGLNAQEAHERLLLLPKSIPSIKFKECVTPDKEHATPNVNASRSVELMGGRFFIDTRLKDVNLTPKNTDDVEEYVRRYIENDKTFFNNKPIREYNDQEASVKCPSSNDIKDIIKALRGILKDWEKVYSAGDKYRVADRDFDSVDGDLGKNRKDWDPQDAKVIVNAFSTLVRNNQHELLDIRSKVNSYLVFLVNGMIEFCYTSMLMNAID